MTDREPPAPRERGETVRQALRRCLEDGPQTARELSSLLSITERDVVSHLEHLRRSLQQQGARLKVEPAECQACEFRFERRKRLGRPGACPRCRSTWIAPPAFWIETDG